LIWQRDGEAILPGVLDHECQCCPTILRMDDRWHMWFGYRCGTNFRNAERGYRIGYAWSDDLESWQRDDSLSGLEVSREGWDSEMAAYPKLFTVGAEVYLFYNGNLFGEAGFGCARLVR
jgi:hypothetical protein